MKKQKDNLFIVLLLYFFTLHAGLCSRWLSGTGSKDPKAEERPTLPDVVKVHTVDTSPKRKDTLPDIVSSHVVGASNTSNSKPEVASTLPDIISGHVVEASNTPSKQVSSFSCKLSKTNEGVKKEVVKLAQKPEETQDQELIWKELDSARVVKIRDEIQYLGNQSIKFICAVAIEVVFKVKELETLETDILLLELWCAYKKGLIEPKEGIIRKIISRAEQKIEIVRDYCYLNNQDTKDIETRKSEEAQSCLQDVKNAIAIDQGRLESLSTQMNLARNGKFSQSLEAKNAKETVADAQIIIDAASSMSKEFKIPIPGTNQKITAPELLKLADNKRKEALEKLKTIEGICKTINMEKSLQEIDQVVKEISEMVESIENEVVKKYLHN